MEKSDKEKEVEKIGKKEKRNQEIERKTDMRKKKDQGPFWSER